MSIFIYLMQTKSHINLNSSSEVVYDWGRKSYWIIETCTLNSFFWNLVVPIKYLLNCIFIKLSIFSTWWLTVNCWVTENRGWSKLWFPSLAQHFPSQSSIYGLLPKTAGGLPGDSAETMLVSPMRSCICILLNTYKKLSLRAQKGSEPLSLIFSVLLTEVIYHLKERGDGKSPNAQFQNSNYYLKIHTKPN